MTILEIEFRNKDVRRVNRVLEGRFRLENSYSSDYHSIILQKALDVHKYSNTIPCEEHACPHKHMGGWLRRAGSQVSVVMSRLRMGVTGSTTRRSAGDWIGMTAMRLSRSAPVRMTIAVLATIFGLFTITAVLTFYGSGQTPTEAPAAGKTSVVIGTASMSGIYFATGNLIARTVNNDVKVHGIECRAKSTKGSDYNINAIMTGTMEFGIAQSDRVYAAVEGWGKWKKTGPQKDLRAMFSLYAESVALVAADDAGIKTIQDLRGRRVYIGESGSGSRQNAIHALENAGIDYTKELTERKSKVDEISGLLGDGRMDAFFYTVGHPNINLLDATTRRRRVHFVPITEIDKLRMKYPYYTKAVVPKKFYPRASNKGDVETFGVKATFITSAKMADNVVYTIINRWSDQANIFKSIRNIASQWVNKVLQRQF